MQPSSYLSAYGVYEGNFTVEPSQTFSSASIFIQISTPANFSPTKRRPKSGIARALYVGRVKRLDAVVQLDRELSNVPPLCARRVRWIRF
jgi:hypothetical protein